MYVCVCVNRDSVIGNKAPLWRRHFVTVMMTLALLTGLSLFAFYFSLCSLNNDRQCPPVIRPAQPSSLSCLDIKSIYDFYSISAYDIILFAKFDLEKHFVEFSFLFKSVDP